MFTFVCFSEYDTNDPNVFQDDEDMEQEATDDGKKLEVDFIVQPLLTARQQGSHNTPLAGCEQYSTWR